MPGPSYLQVGAQLQWLIWCIVTGWKLKFHYLNPLYYLKMFLGSVATTIMFFANSFTAFKSTVFSMYCCKLKVKFHYLNPLYYPLSRDVSWFCGHYLDYHHDLRLVRGVRQLNSFTALTTSIKHLSKPLRGVFFHCSMWCCVHSNFIPSESLLSKDVSQFSAV